MSSTTRELTPLDTKRAGAFGLQSPTPEPAAEPSASPAPVERRCSLRLRIDGVGYRVRPIVSQADGVIRAFTLKRVGAEQITVAETIEGQVCDCGDFTWRKDGAGLPCKHLAAARACGLF